MTACASPNHGTLTATLEVSWSVLLSLLFLHGGCGNGLEDSFFCVVTFEKLKVGIGGAEAPGSFLMFFQLLGVWSWAFLSLRLSFQMVTLIAPLPCGVVLKIK